ncbi:molybdopterin-dependent oxidoreductase [Natronincola ferrireducens]|uniref:Oxidoreductase molybdopterin binding domain-containing protein n=1 Tax=Natronincola ferrireducens TaxID=393762 RepID=A0A1G8ZQG3_9FIRM|nr:molybdopterin-dependent oxidoreductase [Natronincola ferrireducens]SDK16410.1 Oxidoreductase molybdopterin binding domain-containing protein [Natronincola ferrireducens]
MKIHRIAILLILIIGLTLSGCSTTSQEEAVISTGGETIDEKIVLAGLEEKEIEITVESLKNYETITREVVSVNSSGTENRFAVTGSLLEDVLQDLGHSQKDLKGLRLIAGDGYSMEVPKEVVGHREIVLAYEVDGEPLDQKSRPIRVIVPQERAMYWVRNLTRIEVLEETEDATVNTVIFLEAAISTLPQEDYTYYDSVDQAIRPTDLIREFGDEKEEKTVYIKAVDGLEKNETNEIFQSGYIKVTGTDAPMFLSPDIPKGMYVKDILWFSQGNSVFFTYSKGQELFQVKKLEDKEGIMLKDIIDEVGLREGQTYKLTAVDGYSVEVGIEELEKGIVYLGKEGELRTSFEDLPKNLNIKGLLAIEVMD